MWCVYYITSSSSFVFWVICLLSDASCRRCCWTGPNLSGRSSTERSICPITHLYKKSFEYTTQLVKNWKFFFFSKFQKKIVSASLLGGKIKGLFLRGSVTFPRCSPSWHIQWQFAWSPQTAVQQSAPLCWRTTSPKTHRNSVKWDC